MRRLLLALALVAFMALPASAAVQNVKVSGSVESTWLVRDQFGLGLSATDGFYQNLLITQAILRVDADLTDNVSAVVELINEREWGDEADEIDANDASYDLTTDVQVNLAYVTLREMLYSPLTVVVGRQNLYYGHGMIIGDYDTNNTANGRLQYVADDLSKRKSFDAIKAIFDYDPLTIDVFAAKVDANTVSGRGSLDDVSLYGINANWQLQDERNSEVEAYFFAEINESVNESTGDVVGIKADTIYTPGLRIASNPIEGLYTSAEVAWQFGNKTHADGSTSADNMDRQAMAAQMISSYAIPGDAIAKYSPIVSGSYTWATGDTDGTATGADKYDAWDPMYEDQGGGTIWNTLFDQSNFHISNIAIQFVPLEDLTTKISWWNIILDKEFSEALTTGTTFTRVLPENTSAGWTIANEETHLGSEVDVDLLYDYTEDVQIGFSAGWFFPGDVFADENEEVAKQFLTNVNVNF